MSIEQLAERITSDPAFAEQLRTNPETALRSVGIEPTPELVEAAMGSTELEELLPRISKGTRGR